MGGYGRRGDVLLKGCAGHKAADATCISEALDANDSVSNLEVETTRRDRSVSYKER